MSIQACEKSFRKNSKTSSSTNGIVWKSKINKIQKKKPYT